MKHGKEKGTAKLTGGAGFRYEDLVAARFLLDLLGGTNGLGQDFGRVTRVDWQARDAEWLADDLAISCITSDGARAAGLSIKSNRQVKRPVSRRTSSRLRGGSGSGMVLIGNCGMRVMRSFWSPGLSPMMSKQLGQKPCLRHWHLVPLQSGWLHGFPAQEREARRPASSTLFASFRCPEQLRKYGDTGDIDTIRLLRHVRLLHFDYEAQPSRDQVRALADCQSVLSSGSQVEATALWDRLLGFAAQRRVAGGSADLPELLAGLRGEFQLRDHPDYRRDWEALDGHSKEVMDDVRQEMAGVPRVARDNERTIIVERLNDHAVCFLAGESGSGKSALAKETATGAISVPSGPVKQ